MGTASLNTLITTFRLRIGDTNPATYRYTDEWLRNSLIASVEVLGKWWNFKYLLDSNNDIYRNPNISFLFDESTYGVIEPADKVIIVIMACIILLEGSLENASWNLVSWRDNEVSVSSQEVSRTKNENLKRFWNELLSLLTPPTKKLAWTLKGSLPGYKNNRYEKESEY